MHADLVFPVFSQILHPRRSLIATSVNNFQISDLESRNSEERNLKVNVDGLLFVQMTFGRLYRRQFEISTQHVLPQL